MGKSLPAIHYYHQNLEKNHTLGINRYAGKKSLPSVSF